VRVEAYEQLKTMALDGKSSFADVQACVPFLTAMAKETSPKAQMAGLAAIGALLESKSIVGGIIPAVMSNVLIPVLVGKSVLGSKKKPIDAAARNIVGLLLDNTQKGAADTVVPELVKHFDSQKTPLVGSIVEALAASFIKHGASRFTTDEKEWKLGYLLCHSDARVREHASLIAVELYKLHGEAFKAVVPSYSMRSFNFKKLLEQLDAIQ
jgi:hypothetical protein